ncbi:MAG TPA: tetratricopeptide repeat protein [Candidatus Methylomirabilis sp.]|nr:tetratricopeptide repeat protein [Candidatus Methylomirabilis sp.]
MRGRRRFTMLLALVLSFLAGCGMMNSLSTQLRQGYQAQVAYRNGLEVYQARQYDRAISEFRRAIDLDPTFDEAQALLAWSYYYTRHYPEAALHFRRAIARQPQWGGLYDGLGWTRYRVGRYHIALEAFQQSSRLDRADRDPMVGTAFSLFELRRYAEALPLLEQLTREGERSPFRKPAADLEEVRSRYAWSLFYLGSYDRAKIEFEKGIAERPEWYGLQNGLGWSLVRLGNRAEARTHFQQALRLQPNFPDAREGLAQVGP